MSEFCYLVVAGLVKAKFPNGDTVSLPQVDPTWTLRSLTQSLTQSFSRKGSSFGEKSVLLNQSLVSGLHFRAIALPPTLT